MPRATQSAGVPLTRYDSMPSITLVRLYFSGRVAEIEWLADDRSPSGATTVTSPK